MADIVVCVDGTWCGPQTTTKTNTYLLACTFSGGRIADPQQSCRIDESSEAVAAEFKNVHVLYMPGDGVDNGDVAGYLVNGALALDIRDHCCKIYRFIIDNFRRERKDADGNMRRATRIWLFGHSRGAHAVRSVAGMINNCGIIDKDKFKCPGQLDDIANEVYSIYRSRDPRYHPDTAAMNAFRLKHSVPHGSKPPVFFMGLLDTVGALGVPQINQGATGVEYELYDNYVSSEVQHVWQGLAAHDRLTFFTPYFALRKPDATLSGYAADLYSCEEVWFPGAHYDIGRQKFVFLRKVQGHWLEWGLELYNTLVNFWRINITFTPQLADVPLKALAQAVRKRWDQDTESSSPSILPDPEVDFQRHYLNWAPPTPWGRRVLGIVLESLKPRVAPYTINAYDKITEGSPLFQLPIVGALLTSFVPIALNDRVVPVYREACFHGDDKAFESCNRTKFKSKTYQTYKSLQLTRSEVEEGGGHAAGGSRGSNPTSHNGHASAAAAAPHAGLAAVRATGKAQGVAAGEAVELDAKPQSDQQQAQ